MPTARPFSRREWQTRFPFTFYTRTGTFPFVQLPAEEAQCRPHTIASIVRMP